MNCVAQTVDHEISHERKPDLALVVKTKNVPIEVLGRVSFGGPAYRMEDVYPSPRRVDE
jgi:hypothetical protein